VRAVLLQASSGDGKRRGTSLREVQGSRAAGLYGRGARIEQDAWIECTVQGGSSARGRSAWANPVGDGLHIVLTKAVLSVAKLATVGSIGALIYYSAAPLGLPIGNTWFDGFIVGYGVNVFLGSAVSSMVEPDEESSKAYIFFYRYGHAVLNRSTTYFTHRNLWRFFSALKQAPKE
jgi:hypothetical protein